MPRIKGNNWAAGGEFKKKKKKEEDHKGVYRHMQW